MGTVTVPDWLKIPFIEHGYEYICFKPYSLLAPWYTLHNETMNAYTMVFALFLGFYNMMHYITKYDITDTYYIIPFIAYFMGQFIHHPASIAYHLYKWRGGPNCMRRLRNLDVSMILIMNCYAALGLSWNILGPFVSVVCFVINLCIAFNGIISIYVKGRSRHHDRTTIVEYIFTSMMGYYIPIIGKGIYDLLVLKELYAFTCATMMIVVHIASSALYITHVPERYYPNSRILPYVCTSHILMHIVSCVFLYNYGYIYIYNIYMANQ